jgi:phage gp36-like protein
MLDLTGLCQRFGTDEITALIDWAGDGTPDYAAINKVIADAIERVQAHCAARYRIPLEPVPDLVTSIAADIAYYRLHRLAAPDEVRKRYEDAQALLRQISRGEVILPAAPSGQPASADGDIQFVPGRHWPRLG